MKKSKRVIAMLLLVLTIASIFSVTAFAAQLDDSYFFNMTMYSYWRYLTHRTKDDVSPIYLHISEAQTNNAVCARATGTYADGTGRINYTWDAYDNLVDYVRVWPGIVYSVRNIIHESGKPDASLGFKNYLGLPNEITGAWSPDSTIRRTVPNP